MRSGAYQITGYELQAMVNENIIGQKTAIPQTNRCLTRAEVMNCVYVYGGPQDPYVPSIPYTSWPIGGGVYQFGADPYLTCSYEYLTPLPCSSLIFELNQEGNPYLNADLGGYVNGSPLRLDPGSGLDWLYFGGPQYSPQMSSFVKVGMTITVQANFGLVNPDGPSYGWDADGYGFMEVYANGSLIHDWSVFKPHAYGSNLTEHAFSFVIQSNTSYYVKAYSLVTYTYNDCTAGSIFDACYSCTNEGNY